MKNQVLILILILYSCFTIAQKWDHTFGTPDNTETKRDLVESYDNGYMISGSYKIPSSSNWLIKTDINGTVLWDKLILHNLHEVFSGNLDQNNSGEIAIGRCLTLDNGDQWPNITKLDSCGNKLWCREYIDDNYLSGWIEDIILFDNGDVLALAYLTHQYNYPDNIFLYYISANGDLQWRKAYASKDDYPLILLPHGKKLYKINEDYMIVGECYYPNPGYPGTGYIRPLFISIDEGFKENWILPFGVTSNLIAYGINMITMNDSTYMGIGSTGYETRLMFFNNEGIELEHNDISNENIGPDIEKNVTSSIARLNDSLFITSTTFGSESYGNPYGELIIDTAGNVYNSESRPNTTGNPEIIKTFDNKYIIGCSDRYPSSDRDIYLYKINDSLEMDTVYPGIYKYDSLCPYQIESGIIDITDCLLITDIGETPTPDEYFSSLNTIPIKAFPNPVKENQLTLSFQNTEHHNNMELRCFDIFGKKVHAEKVYPFQAESILDIHNWPSGMYFVIIYAKGKAAGECKFVVQ